MTPTPEERIAKLAEALKDVLSTFGPADTLVTEERMECWIAVLEEYGPKPKPK
jgi:hypothetical protein